MFLVCDYEIIIIAWDARSTTNSINYNFFCILMGQKQERINSLSLCPHPLNNTMIMITLASHPGTPDTTPPPITMSQRYISRRLGLTCTARHFIHSSTAFVPAPSRRAPIGCCKLILYLISMLVRWISFQMGLRRF